MPETAPDIKNDSPGIPNQTEQNRIRILAGTYEKTFYSEHTYEDLMHPIRTAQLMLHLSKDVRIHLPISTEWDKHFNVFTAEKKKKRADIQASPVVAGANALEKGEVRQLTTMKDTGDTTIHH